MWESDEVVEMSPAKSRTAAGRRRTGDVPVEPPETPATPDPVRPRLSIVPPAPAATGEEPATERHARIGDDAVKAATGRTWKQWFKILDGEEAATWSHRRIANFLYQQHEVPGWWAQMVTVGFEQARGLRAPHQTATGFTANRSATFEAPLARLYEAWDDPKVRDRWLDESDIEIRTSTPQKSMRITWSDGATRVEVNFNSKGEQRSMVQVQHHKLVDHNALEQAKRYWEARLSKLKSMLEK